AAGQDGPVVDGVEVGAAVDLNGAVSCDLVHGAGCIVVLVDRPRGGDFAEAGSIPQILVDDDVVIVAAHGDSNDLAAVVVFQTPVFNAVQAGFGQEVIQGVEQAGSGTLFQLTGCEEIGRASCREGG